ncbi:MAG: hypothetical protein JSU61_07080, partial [Fidelibacterota bacterium]
LFFLIQNKGVKPEQLSGEKLAKTTYRYLEPIAHFALDLDSEKIRDLNKLYGSGGPNTVRREFQYAIHKKYRTFAPEGLDMWVEEQSGKYNEPGKAIVTAIELMVDRFIRGKLEEMHGKDWWEEGVPHKIVVDCYDRRLKEGTKEPDWNFLHTIDYKAIILHNKISSELGSRLTPPALKQRKTAERISWLDRLNAIRRKTAHPQRTPRTADEYAFLEKTKEWLDMSIGENPKQV